MYALSTQILSELLSSIDRDRDQFEVHPNNGHRMFPVPPGLAAYGFVERWKCWKDRHGEWYFRSNHVPTTIRGLTGLLEYYRLSSMPHQVPLPTVPQDSDLLPVLPPLPSTDSLPVLPPLPSPTVPANDTMPVQDGSENEYSNLSHLPERPEKPIDYLVINISRANTNSGRYVVKLYVSESQDVEPLEERARQLREWIKKYHKDLDENRCENMTPSEMRRVFLERGVCHCFFPLRLSYVFLIWY